MGSQDEKSEANSHERNLDRRQFVLRAGGAIAGASSLGLLLAACGSGGGSAAAGTTSAATGAAPATSAAATTVGPSGELGPEVVIGSSEGDPANLDSTATYSFALTATVGSAVHAYLMNVDLKGMLQPGLATGFDVVSPNEIRFRIRPDVMFQNNRALTPDDVKKSYEHVLDKKTASAFASALSPIKSIAVDGDAVAFTLKEPYAPFPALTTQIPIIPIETAGEQKTKPIGAGPFSFKEWQKGNFMAFERFADYYDKGYPQVEGLRFLPQTDASTLRAAFQSKQSQAAVGFAWPDKKALAAAGDTTVGQVALNGFQFLCMNVKKPPFDDVRVRQAMSIGLDRKRLAEIVFGAGWPPASILIDSKSPFYPADLEVGYDPEKATALLKEAGVAGSTIEGLVVDIPLVRPMAPVWQDEMKKLGLNLKTQLLQPADLIDRVLTRGDYQITQFGDAAPPDAGILLERYYESDGALNIMNYSSKAMDDALAKAAAAVDDEEKRKQLYHDAIEVANKDVPLVVFAQNAINYASYDSIGNFAVTPIYTIPTAAITNTGS